MAYSIKFTPEQLHMLITSGLYTPEMGNAFLKKAIEKIDLTTCKLLAPMVDLNSFRTSEGIPLLHYVIHCVEFSFDRIDREIQIAFFKCFLNAGASPNILDDQLSTPLPESIELFKILLDYGMTPIYEGKEMINYKKKPNPGPMAWNTYIKEIKAHMLAEVKSAVE